MRKFHAILLTAFLLIPSLNKAADPWVYVMRLGSWRWEAANWPRVSVFDGGWFEWSKDPENPVEIGD